MPKKNEAPASFEKALSEGQEFVVGNYFADMGEYHGGFTKVSLAFAIANSAADKQAACSWHVRGRPNYNKPNSAYKFCCLTMKTPL